jgi:hypothetical protein
MEISNSSLLTVNDDLESQIKLQYKTISNLRKQIHSLKKNMADFGNKPDVEILTINNDIDDNVESYDRIVALLNNLLTTSSESKGKINQTFR